ncbi:MAG: kinase [Pseudomonadales bacterium]|nr:kinase [Pseudomonadales bacterium]
MIAVISNPRSGHNRRRFAGLAAALAARPQVRHFVTGSAAELPAICAALRDQPVELLAINGGDGTAAAVFAALLDTLPAARRPLLALLPAGTANMTAGDVGIRGSLHGARRRLLGWIDAPEHVPGTVVERAVLRVEAGAGSQRYGMFLGAGLIMAGTEYAHRALHARGLRDDFSLGLGLVRSLWGIARGEAEFRRAQPLSLRLDGGAEREFDAQILAVSTLQRLFLGIRPFWGRESGPLALSLIEAGAPGLLRNFPGLLRGRPGSRVTPEAGYHSHRACELRLSFDGACNLDGEILQVSRADGPLRVVAAGPLRFLRL